MPTAQLQDATRASQGARWAHRAMPSMQEGVQSMTVTRAFKLAVNFVSMSDNLRRAFVDVSEELLRRKILEN